MLLFSFTDPPTFLTKFKLNSYCELLFPIWMPTKRFISIHLCNTEYLFTSNTISFHSVSLITLICVSRNCYELIAELDYAAWILLQHFPNIVTIGVLANLTLYISEMNLSPAGTYLNPRPKPLSAKGDICKNQMSNI